MSKAIQKPIIDSGVKVGAVVIALTTDQIVNQLFNVQGVTFISAKTITIPSMNKTGNPFLGKVIKNSTIHCMLGADYEKHRNTLRRKDWVNDARISAIEAGIPKDIVDRSITELKEYSEQSTEKFEAKPRKWGKHMINPNTGKESRIMVHHTKKDRKTQELLPNTYKRYMQVIILGAKTPVYRYNDTGEVLSEKEVEILKQYLSKRQEDTDGLVIRDYAIETIKEMTINKTHYTIK